MCRVCHALHHSGHLEIEGDPERGLTWRPRAMGWKSAVEKDLAPVRDLPATSAGADTLVLAEAGLVKLGWTKFEATRRVEEAWRRCSERATTGERIEAGTLVLEAIRL